jgi:hypothetical protein
LENRRMLATVFNFPDPGGDLYIIGDATIEFITITEDIAGAFWQIRESGRITATLPKPTTNDVYIHLGDSSHSLSMFGINQGTKTFVGQTRIEMGNQHDSVTLGTFVEPHAGDFNFDNMSNGSNANHFIGAVSVDLGEDVTSSIVFDDNSLQVANTDFGGLTGIQLDGSLDVYGSDAPDSILISDVRVFGGSINIRSGGGDDSFLIGFATTPFPLPVQLGGNLIIDAGDGADNLTLDSVLSLGNIIVEGGKGDDRIHLGSPAEGPGDRSVGSSTQRDIAIYAGEGDDTVFVNQVTTVNSFMLSLGGDVAGSMVNSLKMRNSSFSNDSAILGGNANDSLDLDAVNIVTNLFIQTGIGNDFVDIQGSLITAGILTIDSNGGNDTVRIDNSNIQTSVLIADDGDDSITLTANLIDDLFADLGNGNDSLNSESTYRRRAFVRGGPGGNLGTGSNFTQGGNFTSEGFGG